MFSAVNRLILIWNLCNQPNQRSLVLRFLYEAHVHLYLFEFFQIPCIVNAWILVWVIAAADLLLLFSGVRIKRIGPVDSVNLH